MIRRRSRRSGYTLLEVMLASVLAVILLAALYATLDITLKRMDVGRELVASNNLSRAVVNRFASDLSDVLGPMPPKSGASNTPSDSSSSSGSSSSSSSSSTQSSGSTTGTGTGTGSTTSTTSTTNSTTTTGSTSDPTASDSQTVSTTDIPFQAGLIGSDRQFTVFMSRVPDSLVNPEAAVDPTQLLPGDLRRVTYYMASDGSGLCRQERPWVTADGVRNSADPDYSNEAGDLIAPEVKDVTFEYLDATTGEYLTTWDGSMPGADGTTPSGPPRAIRATFYLEFPGPGGAAIQKQIQHVFPVHAAVGTYVPATDTTDSSTTTGGM